jgi:pilus assembly protein FimV
MRLLIDESAASFRRLLVQKTPRFKACVLAVALAALPLFGHAAGLGRLNVLSGLGQPFRGEIDLVSVQPNEADSLVVSLAPPESYSNARIEYPPASLGLRFNIEKRPNGQYYRGAFS